MQGSKRGRILAGLFIISILTAILLFNQWINVQIDSLQTIPAAKGAPVAQSALTGKMNKPSPVIIDPKNDPLAPRVKKSPMPAMDQSPRIHSLKKIYDMPELTDILAQ